MYTYVLYTRFFGSFKKTDFPCVGGLIPQPPSDGGSAELIQRGIEFGPCLGTSSVEHEDIPSCPEVSVLVMDDSMDGLGMMKTVFELKTEHNQDLVIDLLFSKEVIAVEADVSLPLIYILIS